MNPVFTAALNLQKFCQFKKWKFCFIGGIAVQRWGEPRLTKDADLTLLTGFGEEQKFIKALLAKFKPRRPDAEEFALHSRVLLLRDNRIDVPLDIAMGAFPFEENAVKRATRWKLEGKKYLITCSAEDLIVHKAFAARGQDWLDVERILMRQGTALNIDLVWKELKPLIKLKEAPEIAEQLRRLLQKHQVG
jgi:hypothetical protein